MTIDRRKFLTITGSSVAAGILAACNSRGPKAAEKLVRYAEKKNEQIERALFRHTSMDATISGSQLAGAALPSYFISKTVPIWDEATRGKWTLEIGGMVNRPMKLTLEQLVSMPRMTERVNHYCVEGWNAIEQWTGVRLSDLARFAGLQKGAEYVDFLSFDDGYHESWDIDSAMHRQTVVAYGLDGRMLAPAHGAPARVYSPTKLGYKNTKYLTKILFLPNRTGGYWSDAGYEWYGGV
ncbi:MAG TPA: molybdopterin-dependent oxidoreductase [Gemmatimonadaceae bacterium]|nr:molybdopterin-dependent oxidoreductase [Gemmatimonadaceae bacterium]